jgi:hypothetical protein
MATRFCGALALLAEAAKYAEHTSGDRWEFAVEIQQFRELGLSANDLRFLVRLHYVIHASEVTVVGRDGRRFRPTGDLCFTSRSCFVLTPTGIAAVNDRFVGPDDNLPVPHPSVRFSNNAVPDRTTHVPIWDVDRHVLLFEGQLVKQFKCPAENQETILAVFQEEGWPAKIDDPLAPAPTVVCKRRLSDAIKCLNRKQTNHLVSFRGDGTGQGVLWDAASKSGNQLLRHV